MKNTSVALWAIASALAALPMACGGDDETASSGGSGSTGSGSGFLGSCDTRMVAESSEGQCRDWSGTGMADLSVSCDGLMGAFSTTDPCPSEGRVGYCTLPATLGIVAVYNYYEPVYTSADAQSECDGLEGDFTVG